MGSPLRIAICEDNRTDACVLRRFIEESGVATLCKTFSSANALQEAFLPQEFDLIFLDIYFDGVAAGIEAASRIRKADEHVVLAFTTVSTDHALDGYRLGALKYLEKPLTYEAVKEALALATMKRSTRETISILAGGKIIEVILDTILYFEMNAAVHAVSIHLHNKTMRASQSVRLDDIEKMLPKEQFVRCHRGFIVNMRRVTRFDGPDFIMENGEKVFVRLKDQKKVRRIYEEFILSLIRRKEAD